MTFADTVRKVLIDVKFRDWQILVGDMNDGAYISVAFYADEAVPIPNSGVWLNKLALQKGRKWYVSAHATKSELVQTALLAILTAIEHEVREEFTYRGHAIFGPHFHIDTLRELAAEKSEDRREVSA